MGVPGDRACPVELPDRLAANGNRFRPGRGYARERRGECAASTRSDGRCAQSPRQRGEAGCAGGMVICLDRRHRLAYILGEVLERGEDEAAAILEISPAAFRKRLSRAREQMGAFLRAHCGIANPDDPCRCEKLVPAAIAAGLVDPDRLVLSRLPHREADRRHLDVERIRTAAETYRSM